MTPQPCATFAYGSSSSQMVDLYRPASSDRAPVVVTIHGGAFRGGSRKEELDAVPALLAEGFAVAAVDYRLSGEACFPAAVRDVKQAVVEIRRRADQLRLDPSFVAAWGRSAGGYLAAMLGVTGGRATEFGDDRSTIQAVVDWYGPADFGSMDDQFRAFPPEGEGPAVQLHDDPGSPESVWLGAALPSVAALVAQANPVTHLVAAVKTPPFSIAAGTNDRLVPHRQSVQLADALRAAGVETDLWLLPGAAHADPLFEVQLTGLTVDWLRQQRQQAAEGASPSHAGGHDPSLQRR